MKCSEEQAKHMQIAEGTVQNRFSKWNMTCHDNLWSAGARDCSKARGSRICLPNLGIAVTPSVAQERWTVPSSAQGWHQEFLPFRAPHCSSAVCDSALLLWVGTGIKFRFSHPVNKIQLFRSFPDVGFHLPPWQPGDKGLLCLLQTSSTYSYLNYRLY